MKTALYPGTFDPFHNGHLDLLRRASNVFERIIVGVAASEPKGTLFPLEERLDMACLVTADLPQVEVVSFEGLLVHAFRDLGADVVVANAGYGRPEPPHKFRPGRALQMYDTNLLGMLRTIDWALPRFLERRAGHLVGIASVASYLGMTNSASYCGSKAAMPP